MQPVSSNVRLGRGVHADQIGRKRHVTTVTRFEIFMRVAIVHSVDVAVVARFLFSLGSRSPAARLQRRLLTPAFDHLFVFLRQIVGGNVYVVAIVGARRTSFAIQV